MLRPYARVLRAPHVAAVVAASVFARLPIGMAQLGVVLFVHARTGSFGSAGVVAGGFAAGTAVSAPVLGRLVDRFGQPRVLIPGAFVDAAALVSVVGLGSAGAPVVAMAGATFVAGVGAPPVGASLRALWPTLVGGDPELVTSAFALDSILLEVFFIAGPLLTAALVAVASPGVALLVAAGFAVGGTLWFCALPPPRAWRGEERGGGRAGALGSPGMRMIVAAMAPTGAAFGALELTLPAFGTAHGTATLAGPFFAALALGSIAGGVLYGAHAGARGPYAWFVRLAIAVPLGCLPLLAATSVPVMFVLVPIAGLTIAPLLASRNQLVGVVAPPGTLTEAYTWGLMANVGGAALGSAVAGAAIQGSTWRAGAASACAFGVVGAAVAFAGRGTLRASSRA